ncbi:MAG: outer rane receptor protein [Sphingobacteriales bacterium]|nr:outer rane receptor protein [Sphingobacteriales bacterium]
MKTSILLSFLFILSTLAFGQTKISGTIKASNGELIKGANIVIKNTYDGTSSDSVGHFFFVTSEKGSQLIQYSFLGFNSDSLAVNLNGTPLTIELVLKEKLNELNTVVISAGSFEASDSKKGVILNSLNIATTAGAEADVFAALQTLPGTQSASGENGLFVRGGSASETKTFFDGMYVKNPLGTQLPDLASRARFSPFMFKGTTFSAGGYSAQYGQALSSALILESKDLPEKTTTGVNIMTVGAGLDHTEKFKNSALTLSGSYINLKPAFLIFKQRADYDKEPEQYGGSLHYKLKTSATGIFKLYGEMSNSKVGLFTDNLNNPVQDNYFSNHNNNIYLNSTFQDFLNDKWKIQGGASYSIITMKVT